MAFPLEASPPPVELSPEDKVRAETAPEVMVEATQAVRAIAPEGPGQESDSLAENLEAPRVRSPETPLQGAVTIRRSPYIDFDPRFLKQVQDKGLKIAEPYADFPVKEKEDVYNFGGFVENQNQYIRENAPEVPVPRQMAWTEFAAAPFLPVVVKDKLSNRGQNIFFVETAEQLQKLTEFMQVFAPMEGLSERMEFQEFIAGPSDYYTSIRVLASATGRIFHSGVLYRKQTVEAARSAPLVSSLLELAKKPSSPLAYLSLPSSDYFLNSKRITSNAGGVNMIILKNEHNKINKVPSDQEKAVLVANNLPEDGSLPEVLEEQARAVATTLGKEIGLVTGIDFVPGEDGEFYFLEANFDPGLNGFLAAAGRPRAPKAVGYQLIYPEVIKDLVELSG